MFQKVEALQGKEEADAPRNATLSWRVL